MKYETIYEFVLTSVKKKQILNILEESIKKISDLNKLVSVTHNDKDPISLLNEPHKALMMKWKTEDMSVDKLMKQMKVLILALKITFTVSASASLYPSVAVH